MISTASSFAANAPIQVRLGEKKTLTECRGRVKAYRSSTRKSFWITFKGLENCSKVTLISQLRNHSQTKYDAPQGNAETKILINKTELAPDQTKIRLQVHSNSRSFMDEVTVKLVDAPTPAVVIAPSIPDCGVERIRINGYPAFKIHAGQSTSNVYLDDCRSTLQRFSNYGMCRLTADALSACN